VPSAIIALVTTPAAIEVALPTDVTSPVKFAFVVTVDALLADVANEADVAVAALVADPAVAANEADTAYEADVAVPVKLPVNEPVNP